MFDGKDLILPADVAVSIVPVDQTVQVYLDALHHETPKVRAFQQADFLGEVRFHREHGVGKVFGFDENVHVVITIDHSAISDVPQKGAESKGVWNAMAIEDGHGNVQGMLKLVGRVGAVASHSLILRLEKYNMSENKQNEKNKNPSLSALDEKRDNENKHCRQPNHVKPVRVWKKLLIWGLWRSVDTMLSFRNGKSMYKSSFGNRPTKDGSVEATYETRTSGCDTIGKAWRRRTLAPLGVK